MSDWEQNSFEAAEDFHCRMASCRILVTGKISHKVLLISFCGRTPFLAKIQSGVGLVRWTGGSFDVRLLPNRGNSLNSRADLKEFRLFCTIIFQRKKWNSMYSIFFLPQCFFFFHDDFPKKKTWISFFFWKNNRGQKSKFLKFKVSPWI